MYLPYQCLASVNSVLANIIVYWLAYWTLVMYVEIVSLLCVKWRLLDYEETSSKMQAIHVHLALDAFSLLLFTLPWIGNGYTVRIKYWLGKGNVVVFTHAFLLFSVVWAHAKH